MIWGLIITVSAVAAVSALLTLAAIGLLVVGDWAVKRVRWFK